MASQGAHRVRNTRGGEKRKLRPHTPPPDNTTHGNTLTTESAVSFHLHTVPALGSVFAAPGQGGVATPQAQGRLPTSPDTPSIAAKEVRVGKQREQKICLCRNLTLPDILLDPDHPVHPNPCPPLPPQTHSSYLSPPLSSPPTHIVLILPAAPTRPPKIQPP